MARFGVLFVHPSDELYGADRILLEVVQLAAADATVWLPDDLEYPERRLSRRLVALGVRVDRMPLPALRRSYLTPRRMPWLASRALRSSIRLLRARPRLVYLNTSACLPLAPAAWLSRGRVVAHIHESWGPREQRLLGWLLPFVHEIVVVSDAVRDRLPQRARRRARVVYNGLAGVVVEPPHESGPMTFLVASRWSRWKGHELLLEAWNHVGDECRLIVLGGPPPIGASVDVRLIVSNLRAPQSVELVGEVDDVASWLRRVDCVIVPSTDPDPLPTIALEASAHGRPVIASRCGGLPEIVDDGVTGVLVSPGDACELADAIRAMTRTQAEAMGAAALDRFTNLFSLERFRREIAAVVFQR